MKRKRNDKVLVQHIDKKIVNIKLILKQQNNINEKFNMSY